MTLADTRNILRSDLRNILVEAPAGCGKTFEAADLAVELGVPVIGWCASVSSRSHERGCSGIHAPHSRYGRPR